MTKGGTLTKLFKSGSKIATKSTPNLFQSLESRELTAEEKKIVDERVALQRRLLEQYEQKERRRKIAEVKSTWPQLTDAEAEKALELCQGVEEDALLNLTYPDFMRKVKRECGTWAKPSRPPSRARSTRERTAKDEKCTRGKVIDAASLDANIFVGKFGGRVGQQKGDKVDAARLEFRSRECIEELLARQRPTSAPDLASHENSSQDMNNGAAAHDSAHDSATADAAERPVGPPDPRQSEASTSLARLEAANAIDGERDKSNVHVGARQGRVEASGSAGGPLSRSAAGLDMRVIEFGATAWTKLADDEILQRIHAFELKPVVVLATLKCLRRLEQGRHRDRADLLHALYKSTLSDEQYAQGLEYLDLMDAHAQTTHAPPEAPPASDRARAAAAIERLPDAEVEADCSEGCRSEGEDAVAAGAGAVDCGERAQAAAPVGVETSSDCMEGACVLTSQAEPLPSSRVGRESCATAPAARTASVEPDSDCTVTAIDDAADADCAKETVDDAASLAPESVLDNSEARRAGGAQHADASTSATPRQSTRLARAATFIRAASAEEPTPPRRKRKASQSSAANAVPPDVQPCAAVAGPSTASADDEPYRPVISVAGNALRGRVKQQSMKRASLLALGTLRAEKGWYNAGYIFPDGFHSRLLFRSSVQLDSLVAHDCFIVGEGGQHWPAPTFMLLAADRVDEPLIGKSCTSCWSQVLQRINAEIQARRQAGEDLPPPPKTAIAGPEYFGLNSPEIMEQIEALDPTHLCTTYWRGKAERLAAQRKQGAKGKQARGQGKQEKNTGPCPALVGLKKKRGRDAAAANDLDAAEEVYRGPSAWSAVSRSARYRARCEGGGEAAADDNPMPGHMDPITLEPVVNPAMGPSGHVMGMATWRAVLSETGCCPFTKQPLSVHKLVQLTKSNFSRHAHKIIGWDDAARG